MAETVLITIHDLPLAGDLRKGFKDAGYAVEFLAPGENGLGVEDPVLLILTGEAQDAASAELAHNVRRDQMTPVFAVTAPGDVNFPDGDFTQVFQAPADPEEILLVGRTTIERTRLQRITGIVGETDAMREVLERVVQIAPVGATVLITGESGTGKELVARGIHALSPRRHRAFIALNVAALSDTLLESELFGHEKGAFTGAIDARKGFFELADQGTIFLDEIGEMPHQTQTKLLRVLEQEEFLRVGGEKPLRVDVRIIAATNRRLRELVSVGEFRKDLYYRLNVLNISLPPLRNRQDDIPRLVAAFIEDASERHDRPFLGIADDAMEILVRYRWPGNVRELRNLIESMVVLAPGRIIGAGDIPKEVRDGEGAMALVPLGPMAAGSREGDTAALRPQLEFLFRSMMDLKVNIDDLRQEFDAFRRREPERILLPPPVARDRTAGAGHLGQLAAQDPPTPPDAPTLSYEVRYGQETESPKQIIYESGMTIEEMERRAIRFALDDVGGNRRRAAEVLEIGERTLYRKIKKFGLEG